MRSVEGFAADLLKGERILITGGGSGLGFSIARRLAHLGASIAVCGRREAVLEEAAATLRDSAVMVETYVCDIRDPDSVEGMFDAIWAEGPLTGLINNAAGNFIARSETLSPNALDAVIRTVLNGTAYCTLNAGRRWIAARTGGIVLSIVATAAMTGRPFAMPSASAKAGVLTMMRSLALEWGRHKIRTVSVAPGMFPTEGAWSRLYPDNAVGAPQTTEIPLGRLGEHRELADLVAFLMSPMAAYVSGDCITMDGGRGLNIGGGAGVGRIFDWTEEDWQAYRHN